MLKFPNRFATKHQYKGTKYLSNGQIRSVKKMLKLNLTKL